MDPLTHTIIAVGLIAVAYYIGRYLGQKQGEIDMWSSLAFLLGASHIDVYKEEGTVVITYPDGTQDILPEDAEEQ
jgi:hypothetical protein